MRRAFSAVLVLMILTAARPSFAEAPAAGRALEKERRDRIAACEREIEKRYGAKVLAGVPKAPECAHEKHDAIVILGCPANEDGTPSECQLRRVEEALRLQKAGLADRFVPTGGPAHNRWVEAEVIKAELIRRGVPEERIFPEPRAEHTDENFYFASRIMRENGWLTALAVSDNPFHLKYSICDVNCCVRLGRAWLFRFKLGKNDSAVAVRYTLNPLAGPPDEGGCDAMEKSSQCPTLSKRRSCEGMDWRLEKDRELKEEGE